MNRAESPDERTEAVKVIRTRFFTECWEYGEVLPVAFGAGERDREEHADEEQSDKKKKSEFDNQAKKLKRVRYYQEQEHYIRRLIEQNIDPENPLATKFLTLTFRNNLQENDMANREFKHFIQRLKYHLGSKEVSVSYLAVVERQKRGAIHYHVLLFDCPYINHEKLASIWGNGFVKINSLRKIDSTEHISRYLSKYFSKDIDHDYKKKKFFRSRNLVEPETYRTLVSGDIDFSNKDVAYSSTYDRPVLDFETGEFKSSRVRYTKIRNTEQQKGAPKNGDDDNERRFDEEVRPNAVPCSESHT